MDFNAYISSGILEQYCLGLVSEAERVEVEQYAAEYPAIKIEIAYISASLEKYALANSIAPADKVKANLLLSTYVQESGAGKQYPPLVSATVTSDDFIKWASRNPIPSPEEAYHNLFTRDLPSTDIVINFMVWAKEGLDEEAHSHYNEFVVIIDGHCDMYMNGEKKHYGKGEIIRIPPHVPHYAVITSAVPMVAFVQRQLIAA